MKHSYISAVEVLMSINEVGDEEVEAALYLEKADEEMIAIEAIHNYKRKLKAKIHELADAE